MAFDPLDPATRRAVEAAKDPATMRAVENAKRSLSRQQASNLFPTESQIRALTDAMARANDSIRSALDSYAVALTKIDTAQLAQVQRESDEMLRSMAKTIVSLPKPADLDWTAALGQKLQRAIPLDPTDDLGPAAKLVTDEKVDAAKLAAFEAEFADDDETRAAVQAGARWTATALNITLEAARLVLLTYIFLLISFTLIVLIGATPTLIAIILAVTGIAPLDLTKSIAAIAEGDRDQ
nr:hypothetical protein [uncultured Rhodococcus sp.]